MRVRTAISIMVISGFAGLLFMTPGHAQAGHSICTHSPRNHWISWREIESKLIDIGHRMVRLRIAADRCLAVLAMDSKGEYREMLMDPVSGRILHSEAVSEPRSTGILPWRTKGPG